MTPHFTLHGFDFFTRQTRTRFPFRYGIASMTEVPHRFIRVRLEVEGVKAAGLTSEGLPPKWFTKDPETTFEQDLPQMLEVTNHAANQAEQIAVRPISFFEFWRELNRRQNAWASLRGFPPLLAGLGLSLVERAVLDGLCRALRQPLHHIVRENLPGLRLGEIHAELNGLEPRMLLPERPLPSVLVRHTIGLADPLSSAEIPQADRVNDGLPQDLESCIRAYGLRAFKIKLSGKAAHDRERLRAIDALLSREVTGGMIVTLDGNENFKGFAAFRDFWMETAADPALRKFVENVAMVEQPVHRDHALNDDAGRFLRDWLEHPPFIIDESDGALGDLPRALSLGYAGSSHKNCKGIVKGIANACLIEQRRRRGGNVVLTGEDLCNLGPVALLQDLAMMALLGVQHVERNGHHYFRGLAMWPEEWQQAMIERHGDLYTRHEQGFACLRIREGRASLHSVNDAPFGMQPDFSMKLET